MTEMQNQSDYNNGNSWKTASIILGVLFLGAVIFGGMFYSKYKATENKATDLGTQLDSTRTNQIKTCADGRTQGSAGA